MKLDQLIDLESLQQKLFCFFLFNIFFVYYETRFVPGTIHTWVMLVGCLLLLPKLVDRFILDKKDLPLDYLLVGILALDILFGFLLHSETTNYSDFQAYFLMLVTYVYVRENSCKSTMGFLTSLCKWYLLINGVLIILQILTGDFFPASYIAAGTPQLQIASGVNDGPTKTGMLVAFALAALFARLLFMRIKFTMLDWFAFFIGLISLMLAASRAAMFSFFTVVAIGVFFASFKSLIDKDFSIGRSFLVMVSLVSGAFISAILIFDVDLEIFYQVSGGRENTQGIDVLVYKMSNIMDDSVSERFGTISFIGQLIAESPANIFGVGWGTGSFEKLYGLNMHNSWAELLVTTGFIGFFSFLTLIIYVVSNALTSTNPYKIMPMVLALLAIMVFMTAHDILRGRIFWVALGMIAAFSSIENEPKSYLARLFNQAAH